MNLKTIVGIFLMAGGISSFIIYWNASGVVGIVIQKAIQFCIAYAGYYLIYHKPSENKSEKKPRVWRPTSWV